MANKAHTVCLSCTISFIHSLSSSSLLPHFFLFLIHFLIFRIPVEIVFGWLQDDYKKEYCWSVRQSQPEALSALSLDKLEKLAHSTFKESRIQGHKTHNSSPLQTFTLNGVRFTCPAEESYCTGVDMISNSAEMYFINIPRSTEELLKSLSSSETNKQHPVQCLAGSARIRFTEWSFPSTAFSILARLAMDDDAWVKSARELAIYESVEDATKSIDSGRQYLHKDIVPGKINFTETARDQPTYWAWANDTNWMTQAVFKFQGVSLWNVSARFYPEFRPTLHEFIAKHKPEGRGTENWTLFHWQPGWINQDMELVRRNSIGRSPPLTSFVLIDRPPTNALHALLGEMWGVYMLMIVSLSFATLLACVQCLNERKKLSGRSRVSSVSRDHHGPVSS